MRLYRRATLESRLHLRFFFNIPLDISAILSSHATDLNLSSMGCPPTFADSLDPLGLLLDRYILGFTFGTFH